MTSDRLLLFGGHFGWNAPDWTDSDDRVRGGNSQSYLSCDKSEAKFYGTLDIKTLGSAGFASQRTTGDDREWNLSAYDGVKLSIAEIDEKLYTFILKDEILPQNPDDGREQSTISYEYMFKASSISSQDDGVLFIPWKQFRATYRGKEKKDTPNLDTAKIKRMSFMMRSYFGSQEGAFSLTVRSIAATSAPTSIVFSASSPSKQTMQTASAMDTGSDNEPSIGPGAEYGQDKGILRVGQGKCIKL